MVDEITMLKGQIEKLEAENASLKEELAFIKKGRTTTEAIDTRINNMNRSTVRIICLLINGLKMKDILEQLCISSSTYYRVISGKAIGDSQHMKDLYMQYEERKASGRSKYPMIRRYLNGETRRSKPPSS